MELNKTAKTPVALSVDEFPESMEQYDARVDLECEELQKENYSNYIMILAQQSDRTIRQMNLEFQSKLELQSNRLLSHSGNIPIETVNINRGAQKDALQKGEPMPRGEFSSPVTLKIPQSSGDIQPVIKSASLNDAPVEKTINAFQPLALIEKTFSDSQSDVIQTTKMGIKHDEKVNVSNEREMRENQDKTSDSVVRNVAAMSLPDSTIPLPNRVLSHSSSLLVAQAEHAQILMKQAVEMPKPLGEGETRLTYTFKRWDVNGKHSVEIILPRERLSAQDSVATAATGDVRERHSVQEMVATSSAKGVGERHLAHEIVATVSTREVRERLDMARHFEGAPLLKIQDESQQKEGSRHQHDYPLDEDEA